MYDENDYVGGKTANRFMNLPVGAAALTFVGTLLPWLSVPIAGAEVGPLQAADGYVLVLASVLALGLLLVNNERQWSLIPALLLTGYVGLAAAITLNAASDALISPAFGLWATLIGVFAAFAGIFNHLVRPKVEA